MTTGRTVATLATSVPLLLALLPAVSSAQARKVQPTERVQTAKPTVSERGQTPASIGVHGFSVVLVVGGMQAAANSADSARDAGQVPEAARKALTDMKDFLPYKRYQLLDAAWILCCAPRTTQVSGRVRGPDGRDYLYTVDPGEIAGSKLNLRFVMREVFNSVTSSMNVDRMSDTARLELSRQRAEAIRELEEAELQVRTLRPRVEVGTATPSELESATMRGRRAQQRLQDLERMAGGAQGGSAATATAGGRGGGGGRSSVATGEVTARAGGGGRGGTTFGRETMDSSFSISPGETVVIGTSRINGDQALIAILTAATKPGGARYTTVKYLIRGDTH